MSQILSLSTIFSALILTDNVLMLKTILTNFLVFTKKKKKLTFLQVLLTNFFVNVMKPPLNFHPPSWPYIHTIQ